MAILTMNNLNHRRLRIGIYNPYFNMLGGGEKYVATITNILSRKHDVILFFSYDIRPEINKRFNLDLSKTDYRSSEIFQKKDPLGKFFELNKFDLFFYMTDGSVFLPVAKKNYLIVQSPKHIPASSVLNRVKLKGWKIICYSRFMESIIFQRIGLKSIIIPPAINTDLFNKYTTKKENIILTVGRFFLYPHNKKQDFLIKFFKKYYSRIFKKWRLVIAGGLTEEGGNEVIDKLTGLSKDYPVEIIKNISYSELVDLYRKSKIYWHAAGYNEDLNRFPERAEHFGITTLESMSSGCVPVVFAAGGQKDIIKDKINGYLWTNEHSFFLINKHLINNQLLMNQVSENSIDRAKDFSMEKFYENLKKIITI